MSRTFLAEAVYAWPCESISRGRANSPHSRPYQGIDQQFVHTPFGPAGYWSPCAPLVWDQGFPTPPSGLSMSTNPVKAPDIRLLSSRFRKQPRLEKAESRTSLAEAIYPWPCESILRGTADSPYSRPYQGIWGLDLTSDRY
ncbi:unnamed protein product [Schistosoma mattheei]|uniref:Uncharacterized protein n=1 Tax=Schistosoma mattheei TaxID=31246 RepID=A0A183NI34_9TREM|nr:unnamed protein product [Schistosoma mattheei]